MSGVINTLVYNPDGTISKTTKRVTDEEFLEFVRNKIAAISADENQTPSTDKTKED